MFGGGHAVVFWVATVAFVALAWRTPSFDPASTSERLALRRIWPNCLGHGCIVCRAGTDFPTLSREVRLSWTVPASVPSRCSAHQTPSGDADDRGNLSRSTRLGPLQCVERRRGLEGLLGQVGDGILSKLGGPGHTSCARPARRRQDRRGAGGRCLNRRLSYRTAGHRGGPPSTID